MLFRNFFRDIRYSLPRLLSVIAVTVLGVMIYIGMSGVKANMLHVADTYIAGSNISDLWITANDVNMRGVREMRALPLVESVMPRVTLSTKWEEDDEATIKLHTYDEFVQCAPYIEKGRPPQNVRECMLAASFAKARGLNVGDRLTLKFGGGLLSFTIAALVISPEYAYNVSGMDLIPNPVNNGFAYVPEKSLYSTYGQYVYNEVLVKGTPGVPADELIESVKSVMKERCLAVLKFKDNVRAHMLYDEISQLSSMTTTLPSLFFLTAALIMFTTMQRVASGSRGMIGTLKALGYSDTRILAYFLSYALFVVIIGSAIGAIPGRAITGYMVDMYTDYFELPPSELLVDWASLIGAVSIASACCVGSALITTLGAVRENPAECMRPKPPRRSRRNIIERSPLWMVLGFSAKTVVRNIFRNRMRALMCVVGVSLCMALIVTALGMNDTTRRLLDDLYQKMYRYDLQVMFGPAAGTREVEHIARMEGAGRIEAQMSMPVEVRSSERMIDTVVQVLEDKIALMVIDREAGESMLMPGEGVYVAEQLASELGAKAGDMVTFKLIGTRREYSLPIEGIAQNTRGLFIGRSAWRALGESYRPDQIYLLAGEPEAFKETLEDYDFVVSVKSKQEVVSAFDSQMEMMNTMIGIMILFGGVLAFVVLYSLGIMNFYDRIRDLATLCVLGFYPREIKQLILSENMVFTAMGVVAGAFLGMPLLMSLLTTTSVGELTFVPVILPASYAIAAALTLFYAMMVNLLLGRKTKKIDMLGSLKSVE